MTNPLTYEIDSQRENSLMIAKGEGGWRRNGVEIWD